MIQNQDCKELEIIKELRNFLDKYQLLKLYQGQRKILNISKITKEIEAVIKIFLNKIYSNPTTSIKLNREIFKDLKELHDKILGVTIVTRHKPKHN